MLSVDSGGNLRYFSGSGEKTLKGFESLPRNMISSAGASVVTNRFTAMTADRMAKSVVRCDDDEQTSTQK